MPQRPQKAKPAGLWKLQLGHGAGAAGDEATLGAGAAPNCIGSGGDCVGPVSIDGLDRGGATSATENGAVGWEPIGCAMATGGAVGNGGPAEGGALEACGAIGCGAVRCDGCGCDRGGPATGGADGMLEIGGGGGGGRDGGCGGGPSGAWTRGAPIGPSAAPPTTIGFAGAPVAPVATRGGGGGGGDEGREAGATGVAGTEPTCGSFDPHPRQNL